MLRKAQDIRPQWLKWKEAALELAGLPEAASYPEEGVLRWHRLQEELDRLKIRQKELEHAEAAMNEQLGRLQPAESLLAKGPLIDRLAARREPIQMRIKELQEFSGEEAALREQLQRLLRQMDPRWGMAELRAFSGSAAEREAVRRYAAGFAGYDRRMESLALEREQKGRQLEAAEYELRRAEAAYGEKKKTEPPVSRCSSRNPKPNCSPFGTKSNRRRNVGAKRVLNGFPFRKWKNARPPSINA